MSRWQQMSPFEQYVNPEIGELIRRVGLDKTFVRGEGCYLYDEEGRDYLDFLGAYGALPFGHSPDELLAELASFQHTREPIFVQPSSLAASGLLAQRLLAIAPGQYRSVTFQNSGAETVEAALKACLIKTGRKRILSTYHSFHGKTLGALSATGSDKYQAGFQAPLPGFDFVDYGDIQALEAQLQQYPGAYAAVIVEPVQGEGGINLPPADYLRQVRAACDRSGTLLIIDEVQTGLGRTGTLFASAGVQADCLLLAKALGGGVMPIGACLLSENAYSADFQNKHSSTFGGNTLACRIGLKVLDLLQERQGLLDSVRENGQYLLEQLQALAARHASFIKEVRGAGYLIGIEFQLDRSHYPQFHGGFTGIMGEQESLVPVLASYLLNVEGIRVAPTLNGANVMRVEPPLIAGRAECERFIQALARTLQWVEDGRTGTLLAHLLDAEPSPAGPAGQARHAVSFSEPVAENHFAFVLHPLELSNYAEFDESLSHYSQSSLHLLEQRLNPLLDPFFVSTVTLTSPATGRTVTGDFIMVPRSAAQLAAMPVEESCAVIGQAIDMARQRGATLVGLGGHTSIVTGGGMRLLDKGVALTTGNSYTLLTAVEAACRAVRMTGRRMQDMRVAVVGATGSIGSAIARLIVAQAGQVTLVGNPKSARFNTPRFASVINQLVAYSAQATAAPGSVLAHIAQRLDGQDSASLGSLLLAENGRHTALRWSNDVQQSLADADLVLIATNSAERFISADDIAADAILCDISRPANVSQDIAIRRPDVLVLDGGIVEMPGDARLGSRYGIPDDLAYACMAETMMLALEGLSRHTSLGLDLSNDDLELVQALSSRHGFKLAGFRSFDKALDPVAWQRYAERFNLATAEPI
ncbi:aminotransferase class III-fold pyridoxal phosphate-dependent enzyme [Pseudomonas mediterranea]|uniref:aminotransferase class III-fold pyridoxal phosphate-dependent enzyme n=1 Tax=Pseudomonas mediterranea TaxID=183795 RepID=UPI0006D8A148|nr:aminotransferase class III-fold pyridoxal phosphate-dependent enzyme [Pseudomonas mediterranea]